MLLSHASLLHDIGAFINVKKHNKHTKYLIEKDDMLYDYPEKDKRLLSLIAYNHRKKIHRKTTVLPKRERDITLKLSSILRVADSIAGNSDSGREVVIKSIHTENNEVRITVEGILPERLNDRLNAKKDLFNEVFRLDVILNA